MSETQTDYATRAKTIFRVEKNKDNPFVMIDRRPLENPKLSWKAKGLLAYLLSRPDNWIVRFRDLVKRSPDGAHTVRAAMKELRALGHVKIVAEREGGKVTQWTYTVYESPDGDFQQVEKQQVENRTFNNTDSNDNDSNDIEEEGNPKIQNVFMVYTSEIGLLTPIIADALEDWEKLLPEKWICDAIAEAAKNNARNWKYVEAILKRWKAQGSQESAKKNGNGKTPAEPPQFDPIRKWVQKKQQEQTHG